MEVRSLGHDYEELSIILGSFAHHLKKIPWKQRTSNNTTTTTKPAQQAHKGNVLESPWRNPARCPSVPVKHLSAPAKADLTKALDWKVSKCDSNSLVASTCLLFSGGHTVDIQSWKETSNVSCESERASRDPLRVHNERWLSYRWKVRVKPDVVNRCSVNKYC